MWQVTFSCVLNERQYLFFTLPLSIVFVVMGTRLHLQAIYKDGHHVTVEGQENQATLGLLGEFGIDSEERKRRDINRQGLQDRQVSHSLPQPSTDLTLHEAFFLTSALGCLQIHGPQNEILDITTCWTKFREYYAKSNDSLDFALEYATYYYLRTLGWTIRSGENYGVNFLLYDAGVSTSHSKYAVLILEDNNSAVKTTWIHLLTKHRVAQSVNKKLLIALVKPSTQSYSRPDCIQSIEISLSSFTGNASIGDCLSD